MRITLYLDIIFCINLLADFAILCLVSCIHRERLNYPRLFAGAAFGAGLLILFLCIPGPVPKGTGIICLVGISMGTVFAAFGKKGFIRKWFSSTTILFLAGSIMNYVKMITNQTVLTLCGWLVLFMTCIVITFALVCEVRRNARLFENIYPIEICNADKTVYCRAFLDTGLFLTDPLFGKPVLLVSRSIAVSCLKEEDCRFIEAYEKNGMIDYSQMLSDSTLQKNCFHEIAFSSVGNPSGRILCFLIDEMKVGGKDCVHRKQPVAVAPNDLFRGTEYQGLIHRDCL